MTDSLERPPSPSSAVATVLGGRYLLGECIGEGGSALVYRARDTHLEREVAVKILHDYVVPADRVRFEREIRTLAHLEHPGVVSIHDIGHDGEGRLYFIMQILEGGAFHQLGPLEDSPEMLERFFRASLRVIDTLEYLHASNLIHRDLTPHNILLGKDGQPRVMDFGLVYLSEGTRDLTRSGYTLGTPHYMAPEQAKGLSIGSYSDIYAFGAVMYRATTGAVLFEADNDQSVLFQHVYEQPLRPDHRNPALPAMVSSLVLSFLEKSPEKRPGTGAGARNLLEQTRGRTWFEHSAGQYRGGRARSGVQPGGPAHPTSLEGCWETALGGEVSWPAAVTGGRDLLTVGTRDGKLHLLEHSGHIRVSLNAADEVTAPATLEPDALVYASWDGVVRCLHPQSLKERWTFKAKAEVTAAPTRWGNRVMVAARDGFLYALNAETGLLEWSFKAGGPLTASPLMWSHTVILADEGGWIQALEARTGKALWKVKLETVNATPAIARLEDAQLEGNGDNAAMLLVPGWSGELSALRLECKGPFVYPAADPLEWTYDLEGELWASPAVYEGVVYAASWSGVLHALTLEDAEDVWALDLGGRVTSSPVVSGAFLYVATEEGRVAVVDREAGRIVWERQFEVGVQATPLVQDGVLYVAFMDGTIRAFREI